MSFITKEEVSVEIQRLINLQSSVFLTLQQDARTLIDGLANQADVALRRDRSSPNWGHSVSILRMQSVKAMGRWIRCKRSSTATTLPSRRRLIM